MGQSDAIRRYRKKNPDKIKVWSKKYRLKHIKSVLEYNRKYNKTLRDFNKEKPKLLEIRTDYAAEWFIFKGLLKCKICSFMHPVALDFHHRDRSKKKFVITMAMLRKHGSKKFLRELAKCDVLCSNCHRIHHWEERGKKL